MAISEALTTENIVPILKKAGFATKDDILASEKRITRKLGVAKRELALRIAKLATETPTYKEFKELKEKTKTYI